MVAGRIEIVCHRGANEYAPENTYASAQYCIDWGVDYLEIDVNTSRDGVMYVFHGPELARTTNGSGKLYELNSDDIDQLDCGSWFSPEFSSERIPRLDQFLDWVDHRVKLFFDVKWADLIELRQLISTKGIADECFFWFGRDRLAREFRQIAPELSLKMNVSSPADVPRIVSEYAPDIVEFSLQQATPAMLETCRAHNLKTMILHRKNEPAAFHAIIDAGVDMVNLDHADHFLRVAERHQQV